MFKSSFSIDYNELKALEPGIQGKIKSCDEIDLAYIAYAATNPQCCLIFYHGGGANYTSYTRMAQSLKESNIATFLFDIRGHGQSGGPRGYSATKDLVWSDISQAIQFVKKQYPGTAIYLGGHSSGAGLILNYSSWVECEPVNGYLMIAPELGYRVAKQKTKFATVSKLKFMLNKISKGYICNKSFVVRFNYSESQINELGFLPGYTIAMAEAVTPNDPFNALVKLDQPLYVILAGEDELIDNSIVKKFLSLAAKENPNIIVENISDAKHIMILKDVHSTIKNIMSSD